MIAFLIYKSLRRLWKYIKDIMDKLYCIFIFKGNNVNYSDFTCIGTPYVMVANGGSFLIGKNLFLNSGIRGNPIGCYDKCTFFVDKGAKLTIGNNVGISQSALICHCNITIEDNVKIGGGVKIFDTDFHSLDHFKRNTKEDIKNKVKAPVLIKNNAFIGAYSIVLKGVTIGKNSIVGAGSVVTKSIPDNQIWAGNPAKFIREI